MVKIAFITGITGQDGSYLSELLIEKGYKVYGIVRRTSLLYSHTRLDHIRNKLILEYGDLSDGSSLTNYITKITRENEGFEVFEVYNLAAQSHVQISFEIPEYTSLIDGLGTLKILEAIRTLPPNVIKRTRFYQAGTSEMFGAVLEKPQKETTPFNPQSPYACAKVYSHFLVNNYRDAYNLFACNGILFNHESPRRGTNFVTNKVCKEAVKIKLGLSNELKLGNLDATRDWGHAKDYVEAMWMILQQDTSDDYVCSTGISHSVQDLCEYTFSKFGLDYKEYVKVDEKFLRPEELHNLKGDSSKLKSITGWTPNYTFESMLDEMLEYWINFYTKNK